MSDFNVHQEVADEALHHWIEERPPRERLSPDELQAEREMREEIERDMKRGRP